MADKFDVALDELRDALTNGEPLKAALKAVAADHDLRPEALRNRATLRWGDVERRAKELASSVGLAFEKKLARDRLKKLRDIQIRMRRDDASWEEIQWYKDYTIGSEWSERSKDRNKIDKK